MMKEYKRSEQQQRIIDGLSVVYKKLIEYKRKTNHDIVIIRDNKIIHLKP